MNCNIFVMMILFEMIVCVFLCVFGIWNVLAYVLYEWMLVLSIEKIYFNSVLCTMFVWFYNVLKHVPVGSTYSCLIETWYFNTINCFVLCGSILWFSFGLPTEKWFKETQLNYIISLNVLKCIKKFVLLYS